MRCQSWSEAHLPWTSQSDGGRSPVRVSNYGLSSGFPVGQWWNALWIFFLEETLLNETASFPGDACHRVRG